MNSLASMGSSTAIERGNWFMNRGLPLFLSGAIAIGTFWMWQTLVREDQARINQMITAELDKVKLTIGKAFDLEVLPLVRMTTRWNTMKGMSREEWEADVRNTMDDFSGLRTIEWVDAAMRERWVVSKEGTPKSQIVPLDRLENRMSVLMTSLAEGEDQFTPPVAIVREGNHVVVLVPSVSQSHLHGFILGVFQVEEWFTQLLTEFPAGDYGLKIYDGEAKVVSMGLSSTQLAAEWAVESQIVLARHALQAKIYPSHAFLSREQSRLPQVSFIIGILMALLFGLVSGMAQVARRRQMKLETMNQELKKENAVRTRIQSELEESEQRFRFAFEDGPMGLALVCDDFSFMTVNKALCRMLGYSEQDLMGLSLIDVTYQPDVQKCVDLAQQTFGGDISEFVLEQRCLTKQGDALWVNLRVSMVTLPDRGTPYLLATVEDIMAGKQMEELQALQTGVLEKAIQGCSLKEVLEALCLEIEQIIHPSICTVMLLDKEKGSLSVEAAPSGSPSLCAAFEGLVPGDQAGSCGTAAFTGEAVIVDDTAVDSRWEPFREVAKKFGIKSCWSIPIISQGHTVLGTFAISHPQPRHPTSLNLKVLETGSYLAGVVLQSRQALERLQASEDRYRDLFQSAPLAYITTNMDGRIISANARTAELLGYSIKECIGRPVMDFYARTVDGQRKAEVLYALTQENIQIHGENVEIQCKDGCHLWINMAVRIIHDPHGNPIERREIWEDVTDKRQTESLLGAQKAILEQIARGKSLSNIMNQLCFLIEAQTSGLLCSIHFLEDQTLYLQASPNLPETYTEKINCIPIGPSAGSCGTAAYRNQLVIVSDIDSDPLWKGGRELALSHGLRACWSTPIRSSQGQVLGTFAVYYQEQRLPTPMDQRLIDIATSLAGIAIERRKAQEAIEHSEDRLRLLYEDNPTMYFTVSSEGIVLSVNRFGATQLGYPVDELVGQSVLKVVHPEDKKKAKKHLAEIFRSPNRVLHWELRKVKKDETLICVKETARVSSLSEGDSVILIVCEEITKRKLTEKALQEQIELAAFDADVSLIVMQREGLQDMLQSCMESLVGFLDASIVLIWTFNEVDQMLEPQASVGLPTPLNKNFNCIPVGSHKIWQIAAGRIPYFTNNVVDNPQVPQQEWVKEEGLMAFVGYPLIQNDTLVGVIALFARHALPETSTLHALETVASHITLGMEKIRAEQAQRESEGRLQAILDNSSAVIYMKDLEGRFLLINKTYEKLFHLHSAGVKGKTDFDIFPLEMAKAFRNDDQLALKMGQTLEKEEIIPQEDGLHTYLSNKFPLINANGQPYAICGMSTDITTRKKNEEALQASEKQLRGLLKERTRISQDLHDHILQSLYAVGLIIAAAKQPISTNTKEKGLGYLEDAITQLNVAIEEIRMFIEGLPRESLDSGDFTTELHALVRTLNLPLSTEFDVRLDPYAVKCLDKEKALHLLNIARESMSNCMRHANASLGTISLTQLNGGIRFEIQDNGIGFEPNGHIHVGHGLNNMYARVHQMNGTLQILSGIGKGTQIIIEFPKEEQLYETRT
jgi:PAS domain S-box-containing protein